MKHLFVSALLCICSFVIAQSGHDIKVSINGYDEDVLYMAYHYGSKQYVNDTIYKQSDNSFRIQGDLALDPGNYLLVMAPNLSTVDILITENSQHFEVSFDREKPLETADFKGNYGENMLFFNYLKYLSSKRAEVNEIKNSKSDSELSASSKKEVEAINDEVKTYQMQLIRENSNSLTAALIKSAIPLDMPEFSGTQTEIQTKRWRYTQAHYLDNIDLSDERLLRTSILEQRIDYYVNKLQVTHPDTISQAIDYVLDKTEATTETFKYILIHFLNQYAKSKIVGMDAVYVHLIDNYYAKGMAKWTEESQLKKILANADVLRPLLLGKIAPDLNLVKRDGSDMKIHDIKADYTILYFWNHDCGHCKKSTPDLKDFYRKFKDKGVEIAAICTKLRSQVEDCWAYVDEQEIGDWLHLSDPNFRSRFSNVYDIKTTPQIYILDANKKILSKRIGAHQLDKVLSGIMSRKGTN